MKVLPALLAVLVGVATAVERAQGARSSSEKDSTHRQYSSLVDNISQGSTQNAVYKSSSSGGGGSGSSGGSQGSAVGGSLSYGGVSGEVGQRNAASYIGESGAKTFQGNYGVSGAASSVEYGGAAEGTGNFPSVFQSSQSGGYPSAAPTSGGYPASLPTSGGYPASSSASASASVGGKPVHEVDLTQPHGPAYTYYYQHYPSAGSHASASGGWSGGEGHEEGGGGLFGGDFGGLGAGGGGLAGLGGLKGLGILAAAAKGILAIKPFLIIGLLFLIAIPVLLLFLPVPIVTVTGTTNMVRLNKNRSARTTGTGAPGSGSGSSEGGILSYMAQLSEKVLTSEECLERLLCKMPNTPENYRRKVKSLWEQWGQTFVKNPRISRGLKAYFDNASVKNRNFKCDQKFQCSNKYI